MYDILIKGANILAGDVPAFFGNVGIAGDKIVYIGEGNAEQANVVIDGTGLLCCPGFIDSHGHADVSLPYYPETDSLIAQGITSHVGGHCGISLAPALNKDFANSYYGGIGCGNEDIVWKTFEEWLTHVDKLPLGANYVPIVGLNAIRGSVMGLDYARSATDTEIEREKEILCEALRVGAFGMSYSADAGVPGHYAKQNELLALFSCLRENKSLVTVHTRHHQNQWPSDDGRTYYGVFIGNKGEALCGRYHGLYEFVELHKQMPGLRAVVAHFTNAFLAPMAHSQRLEDAMIDETLDVFVNTPLSQGQDLYYSIIPADQSISSACLVLDNLTRSLKYDNELNEYQATTVFLQNLKSKEFRARMRTLINSGRFKIGMLSPATDPYWADCYAFIKAKNKNLIGKTLMDVVKERTNNALTQLLYEDCIETIFDLVSDDPQLEWALIRDKREYMGFKRLLSHPRSMPMTDTASFSISKKPSRDLLSMGIPPIAFSCFVRYLCDMVKESKFLTFEEAIRKITALPADVFGIKKRGRLQIGNYADVVLLDRNALGYQNDFLDPYKLPQGIVHVIVNGQFALKDKTLTGNASGRVLRKE